MSLLSQKDVCLVRNFVKDPTDRRNKLDLNSLFWEKVYDLVREAACGGEATSIDLSQYEDLFNFGIMDPSLLEDSEKAVEAIKAENTPVQNEEIFSFIEWITYQYRRLLNFDKREHLKKEIELNRKEIQRKERDIEKLVDEREEYFINSAKSVLASKGSLNSGIFNKLISRFRKIYTLDALNKEISQINYSVSQGKFLISDQKRDLVAKKKEYEKGMYAFESLITELREKEHIQKIKNFCEDVNLLVNEVIMMNAREIKFEEDLDNLKNEQLSLSPIEVEAKINGVLDYLKDMMILSSKRLRAEPLAVLTGKFKPVTKKALADILKHVEEFDPKVFNNERVQYMGPPKFVIVPGYGNGLYDWKNNALIIPTIPYKKIEDAVYMAIVEYKLDVDEEKTMINSFNKIENYRGIRSLFGLKDRFAKDYSIFMGQETKGYKVLDKPVRIWFAYEIAPSRHEVKIPIKLTSTLMKADEWKELIEDYQARTAFEDATAIDFYGMGLIHAQEEEFEEAIEMFKKSVEVDPDFLDGYFNLGIICMKKFKKQDAIQAFAQFIKRNPQSYWTGVCQEHIMRLR